MEGHDYGGASLWRGMTMEGALAIGKSQSVGSSAPVVSRWL